jgi:hypothetical protein
MTESERQNLLDVEHLRLLRIGYLITGVTSALWSLFPLIHVTMGLFLFFGGFGESEGAEGAKSAGLFFIFIGLSISGFFALSAILKFLTARAIGRRRSRTLCLITAGISSLAIPYGTALGVFSFIVLSRPSVILMFDQPDLPTSAGGAAAPEVPT